MTTRQALALLGLLAVRVGPSTLTAQEPSSYAVAAIGRQCLEFKDLDARECQVSESGALGTVGNRTLLYALYCIIPNWTKDGTRCGGESFEAGYHRARALAVFSRDDGQPTALLLFVRAEPEIGILHYEKPQIIHNPAGTILHLPIVVDGTGHGNSSEYYLASNGEWERIEAESWLKAVVSQLPPGLEIWKGIWPDLETMTARTGLYRHGDGNCCPTGGSARIHLSIRDRRFVLDSLVVEKP